MASLNRMGSREHLHFVGISGSLMAGAALLAKSLGYEVSGSDINYYPPMGQAARDLGVQLYTGYEADISARPADTYIIGNAVSRGNPLVESILLEGRRYISGAQWLGENILRDKTVIAVAGTHGKTTTASLLVWILDRAGQSPGFLLGGVSRNFGVSARDTDSSLFVVEADEYDSSFFDKRPKFLHYSPEIVLLNNLEFDHGDIYKNVEEITRQVHYLFRLVPSNGRIIVRSGEKHIEQALEMGVYSPVTRFGGVGEWQKRNYGGTTSIIRSQKLLCRFTPPLIGEANGDNILGATAAAHYAGVDVTKLGELLEGFEPPKRRMEKLLDGEVIVYDDFAHHPTAYKRTIAAVRSAHPKRRIVAVFEPRSNTMKSGVFKGRMSRAFSEADRVLGVGDYEWLADSLSSLGKKAQTCGTPAKALEVLKQDTRAGDCIILMSNGDFGNLPAEVVEFVKAMKT